MTETLVTLDLESKLIERAWAAPQPVCAQWTDREPVHPLDADYDPIDLAIPAIARWLTSDTIIVGHYLAYDMIDIMAWYPHLIPAIFRAYDEGRIRDTMLNQKLIDIAEGRFKYHKQVTGYGLGAVSARHDFPHKLDKEDPWRLRYGELLGVPKYLYPTSAVRYMMLDATAPRWVYQRQLDKSHAFEQQFGAPILGEQMGREARASLALGLASAWEIRTDGDRCDALAAKTERYLARLRGRLQRVGVVRADGSKDTKKVKEIALQRWYQLAEDHTKRHVDAFAPRPKKGELAEWRRLRTPSEVPSWATLADAGQKLRADKQPVEVKHLALNADACGELASPIFDAYRDYTTQDAILTRVEHLRAGRILPMQASFDSLLITGRTSSFQPGEDSALKGIQLQNFPRKFGVRECVVARKDQVLLSIDYNSAELHTLAQCLLDLFGESQLANLLNAGLDVHLWFAAQVLGITYEGAKKRKDEPAIKEARQRAKPANFGFPGGMGAAKFVAYARGYGVTLTIQEAKDLRERWLNAFPEMRKYFQWVSGMLRGRETCTVSQIRVGRIRGGCWYTEACNTQFQGLQGTASKEALYQLARVCYTDPHSPLWNWRWWNHVHDENLGEGPRRTLDPAAKLGTQIMLDTFNQFVPDVRVHAEPAAMRRWYKDAELVLDAQGLIIPWVPLSEVIRALPPSEATPSAWSAYLEWMDQPQKVRAAKPLAKKHYHTLIADYERLHYPT
jgi:DNA polymerase-1